MLLRESFESGPAPLAKGVPVEPGVWSGDYTEVVGEQHGVRPESGRKILRFLRADYVGKTNTKESHVADIYRLIDVRLYGQEFADGSAVVQLSALFNAFEFPRGETYVGKLSIHAFDAETVTNGSWRTASAWDEIGLATATAGPTRLDRNPTTWQRLTGDLRLPDLLGTAKGPAREATLHQSISGALAIRQGPWKLIFPNDGQRELYNLQTDLSETKNVAEANPEVVERLTALMKKYIAEGRSTPGAKQSNDAAIQIRKKGSVVEEE